MIKAIFKVIRPRQWIKNSLLFAVLVFGGRLDDLQSIISTIFGAILFSLIASTVYIINDIVDRKSDQAHPIKKSRPIASGALSVRIAVITAAVLFIVSGISAYMLSQIFFLYCMLYLVLNLFYSYFFKHIVILDVLLLASFYVIRLYAGSTLVDIAYISPWLVMTTTFLALFMALGKRRAELVLSSEPAQEQRKVLESYTKNFLDQLIIVTLTLTILTYSLYTFSAPNLPDSNIMMLTIPFVIFGIFRYLYLVQAKNEGETPEEIIVSDLPLTLGIILWGASVLVIFYL
jgi:4-hydroxybenzoate polyprenyltransferase